MSLLLLIFLSEKVCLKMKRNHLCTGMSVKRHALTPKDMFPDVCHPPQNEDSVTGAMFHQQHQPITTTHISLHTCKRLFCLLSRGWNEVHMSQ